jgi:uncharacterized membrane protein
MIQELKTNQPEEMKPENRHLAIGLKPAVQKNTVQKTPSDPVDWEKRIGQVWLPRIFIFILLIGVIWAFKAASNYGLLNEPIKIIAGYVSAAVLIYLGRLQMKKNRLALGHVMLGGSVVLLLIVTFAFHVLYGMIPTIPAFCLNILWIGLGIYFSHYYSSQPLAIVTAIGGYLIPFLLENSNPDLFYFVTFETVFYLTMLVFAMKKRFQILYYVAFVFLHLSFLAGMLIPGEKDIRFFAIAAVLQHFVLYVTYLINRSFINQQLGITFTSFVPCAAWLRAAYPKDQYELVILAVFVIFALISIWFWKKDKEQLSASFVISSFSFMLYLISYFDVEQASGLLMIQGLITIYLGLIALSWFGQGIGSFIFAVGALLTFVHPFHSLWSINFLNWVVLIASLFALSPYGKKVVKDQDWPGVKTILNAVKMILILFFLTFFANALTVDQNDNIRFMAVSFAWAVDAFVTMVIGANLDEKLIRVTGLGLLFLTLAKLVFVDLTYLSILIRAILFIVLGLIGMVISRIYYKGPSNGKS